jgi:hypothetical protein
MLSRRQRTYIYGGAFVACLSLTVWCFSQVIACGESNVCGQSIRSMERVVSVPVFDLLRVAFPPGRGLGAGALVFFTALNSLIASALIVSLIFMLLRRKASDRA